MRAAGYPDGRYTGDETIQVVGLAGAPDSNDAQIVDQTLQRPRLQDEPEARRRLASCTRASAALPRARVHVCPNVGWIRDFADPQTVLDVAFNGNYIFPENNPNWPQLDDPRSTRRWREAS